MKIFWYMIVAAISLAGGFFVANGFTSKGATPAPEKPGQHQIHTSILTVERNMVCVDAIMKLYDVHFYANVNSLTAKLDDLANSLASEEEKAQKEVNRIENELRARETPLPGEGDTNKYDEIGLYMDVHEDDLTAARAYLQLVKGRRQVFGISRGLHEREALLITNAQKTAWETTRGRMSGLAEKMEKFWERLRLLERDHANDTARYTALLDEIKVAGDEVKQACEDWSSMSNYLQQLYCESAEVTISSGNVPIPTEQARIQIDALLSGK